MKQNKESQHLSRELRGGWRTGHGRNAATGEFTPCNLVKPDCTTVYFDAEARTRTGWRIGYGERGGACNGVIILRTESLVGSTPGRSWLG
jgi:hypothetical protein